MRKLIIQKSNHILKNIRKILIILNSKFNVNSLKKYNQNNIIIQFKHSFKNHISNELEVISKDEESSKFVKNIFLETYIFYKFIILNDIIIIDNMNFLKYKEINYHQFEIQVIQKLDKAISNDKYDFEYISKLILIDTKKILVRYNILIILENNFC